jgi:PadR family transcriptional regulator, regulatory protein PadR
MFNRDLSKGSAELLVLTLLEARPRHGYDIGKLIEQSAAADSSRKNTN